MTEYRGTFRSANTAKSVHASHDQLDWNNLNGPKSMGSRSFSTHTPLYGSKRDLWELSTETPASTTAASGTAGTVSEKPVSKSSAFFDTSHAVSRPYVSSVAAPVKAKSVPRNDIFAISHVVSKPTSKMTDAELEDLTRPKDNYSYADRYRSTSSAREEQAPLPPVDDGVDLRPVQPRGDSFNRYDVPFASAGSGSSDRFLPVQVPVKGPQDLVERPRGFVDLEEVLPQLQRKPFHAANTDSATSGPKKSFSHPNPVMIPMSSGNSPNSPTPTANQGKSNLTKNLVNTETSSNGPTFPSAIITSGQAAKSKAREGTTYTDSENTENGNISHEASMTSLEVQETNPPNLQLTFLPLVKNFLGNGRYAKVYLAHYTLLDEDRTTPTTLNPSPNFPLPPQPLTLIQNGKSRQISGGRRVNGMTITTSTSVTVDDPVSAPCAVKQMHATRECFDIARTEARILRLLSGHPNIIQLIGTTSEDALVEKNGGMVATPTSSRGRASRYSNAKNRGGGNDDVDFFDHGSDDDEDEEEEGIPRMLLVLELAPWGTMMDYIASVQSEGVGQGLWMKWAKELASAIDYVHSFGFVHHDVKPHNCLLTEEKDLKLADFGNALPVEGFQPPTSGPLFSSNSFTCEPSDYLVDKQTMSPTLSVHNPISRENSGLSDTSQQQNPLRVGSVTAGSLSPMGFVEKFRTDLENASIRSSRTGSLTDGLGRGTQAYMAPEMFMSTPMKSTGEYSFPVDLYAIGATLFVAATGQSPFTLAPSSVYMMMGIRRGFWMSGLQPGIGTLGPDVSRSSLANGAHMRRSLCSGGDHASPGGFWRNRWLQDGASVSGGQGVIKFGNGDALDSEAVRIMCACLELDGSVRPTARELVVWLGTLGL
ncbi:hypothetical protein HDU77_001689 [Chytriomyces hyalinus]|nr:hypothetical protein HDU77_001689 [Chytriomyces hyalinus]